MTLTTFLPARPRGKVLAAGSLAVALLVLPGAGVGAPGKGPDSVADVAERVMDTVVNISTSQNIDPRQRVRPGPQQTPPGPPGSSPFDDFFDEFFKRRGEDPRGGPRRVSSLGSGVVVDPSGIIITNNHVIGEADEIFANFSSGLKLKAEIIGRDPKTDLAVLRVRPERPLKAASFGDSDKLRVGDWVMAIGNPFGLGGSLTVGVVSARNRNINAGPFDDFIQTDAAINRGNSGGPLFNMDGEIVGINTAIISPSGGSIGIGFAIPSRIVVAVLGQLREFGETRRGWIGVRIQQIDDQIAESLGLGKPRGALIGGVSDNSPAAKGGLLPGDVIVRFDGREVKEMRDLPRIVAETSVDKSVDVVVIRKGQEVNLKLVVGRLEEADRPATARAPAPTPDARTAVKRALGLEFSALNDELRRRYRIKATVRGVVVTGIDRNSPAAADQRLQLGDVILDVAGETVASPADIERRIEALRKEGRKIALLQVSNAEGETRFVPLPLP
jgi:serine protease Do